jgi:hypothetical protein
MSAFQLIGTEQIVKKVSDHQSRINILDKPIKCVSPNTFQISQQLKYI